MARSDPPFNLRMPAELKEAVQKRAAENGRSLNSEITQILEQEISGRSATQEDKDLDKAVDEFFELANHIKILGLQARIGLIRNLISQKQSIERKLDKRSKSYGRFKKEMERQVAAVLVVLERKERQSLTEE